MFDKLRRVIKTDEESLKLFGEFIVEFNARQQWEKRRNLRRTRVAAIVLASAALVSLFFVVFAEIKANELEHEVYILQSRLEDCKRLN